MKADERVELIEGEIIVMAPIGPGHSGSVNISTEIFPVLAQGRFIVQIQNPLHLDDGSEPQPDIALLRPRADRYTRSHATPADVFLVVEVADSSLEYDRNFKAHLYGRNNVPETWVKNLPEDCIERFTEPGLEGYAQHTVHRTGRDYYPGCRCLIWSWRWRICCRRWWRMGRKVGSRCPAVVLRHPHPERNLVGPR